VRAPYWPTSPFSFGGQIGASPNGDTPGDIYRLLGAVVLRRTGQAPLYSGYIASAFILPKGSNNNRVVAPGSEDLVSPTGGRARFFLVGLRPGTAFEVGSTFRPAVQIDPLLPVSIHFELDYPDGRRQTADGVGDATGSFAGPSSWALDVPGVYRYRLRGSWNGFEGRMPGLPEEGGEFYVYSKAPAGAARLKLDGATTRTFSASGSLAFSGSSTAPEVHYALITPGAVIEQGDLPVRGGKFQYVFDPAAVHAKVPLYDVVSVTTGKPQIGRVAHLTFFSEERAGGARFFDLQRVILRGTSAFAPLAYTPGVAGASVAAGPVRIDATDAGSLDAWEAQLDRLARGGELRFVSQEQDTLLPGRRHERLQQLHQGVPIFGAEVTRQIENGLTVSAFGTLHAVGELDPRPLVRAEDAQREIERRTGGEVPRDHPPSLVVLPLDGGGHALAWQTEARTGTDVVATFTDAHTGRVLLEYSDLKTQATLEGRGRGVLGDEKRLNVSAHAGAWFAIDRERAATITTFDLRGDVRRAAGVVGRRVGLDLADVASSATPEFTDGAVVDAHAHAGATYDYLLQRLGRRGLDGRDGPILTLVHPALREDWDPLRPGASLYYTGSFWDGRMAVFGEGLPPGETLGGRSFDYASGALDLVAHELAHGITDASSRLVYRNESGALNEAFSDIVATAVEFFAQSPGSGPGRADYQLGEDAVSGGGLRSLADPAVQGGADHTRRRHVGTEDNGGVHANSTIASHAFFLAVEGGTNRTSGITVNGVGRARREQIERVFYRAFVYMLPPTATFVTARASTLQSARDLYGPGSAVEHAVAEAWTAVGVP
jgi:Zn-dependent metalloprotease